MEKTTKTLLYNQWTILILLKNRTITPITITILFFTPLLYSLFPPLGEGRGGARPIKSSLTKDFVKQNAFSGPGVKFILNFSHPNRSRGILFETAYLNLKYIMENSTNTRQRNRISTNGTWQLVYIAKAPKYPDLQSETRPVRNHVNNYNTTLSEIFK